MQLRAILLGSTSWGAALLITTGMACAQSNADATSPASATAPQGGDAASDTEQPVIIVTGSRIARPTLDSPIPVTSLSTADLTRSGGTVIGDVLNDLPSLRSS